MASVSICPHIEMLSDGSWLWTTGHPNHLTAGTALLRVPAVAVLSLMVPYMGMAVDYVPLDNQISVY